jgi:hypothetical protein
MKFYVAVLLKCLLTHSNFFVKVGQQQRTLYMKTAHFEPDLLNVHRTKNRSFATTVSQLKMCDFSGETFKGFEVL